MVLIITTYIIAIGDYFVGAKIIQIVVKTKLLVEFLYCITLFIG